MNLHNDYTCKTLILKPDYEGEVTATLISSNLNKGNRASVLYIHGFIDYFFHPHLGEQFNAHNYDFYALDLRKYGRSLLKHQHPNYCKNVEEYFEEISIAIREIYAISKEPILLLGHSTGGLITSNYMNWGDERARISGLILNSPFFDFNLSYFEKITSRIGARILSSVSTYSNVKNALSPAYAESIHKDYYGQWDFNLDWKPINGSPAYFKWIVAIDKAQKRLQKSSISVPVLVMHSSGSIKMSKYSIEALSNDTVLNVEDIKRVGASLGNRVTILQIDNAVHDLFLSDEKVRDIAFEKMFEWLSIIC